jgi:hypothetical protein
MAASEARNFCTECGAKLDDGAKFCAGCGHVVEAAASPRTPPPVAADQSPSTSAASVTQPKKPRPRWRKKRYWIPAALVALIAIIGSTSGGNKKPGTSTTSSAAAASPGQSDTGASTPTKPSVPQSLKDARSYISHHARDINTVQVMVQSVQVAVALAQKGATQDAVNELAQIAQQSHDTIDNVRNNFALDQSGNGALGDAELEVFDAANKLKNSMGALVAYTGDPNAATLAHFTSQYQPAVSEWNDGIRTIWRHAHRRKPPIL